MSERLPLDVSLLALLVDAATQCDESDIPEDNGEFVYTRRVIRGQNLDRTGLAARQIQLLKLLSEPQSLAGLAERTGWEPLEVRRVLFGMSLADLVGRQTRTQTHTVLALEPDPESARQLRELLTGAESSLTAKVVRDRLALQLVLRRTTPDLVIFAGDTKESAKFIAELQRADSNRIADIRWIAIGESKGGCTSDATIARADVAEDLIETISMVLEQSGQKPHEPAEALSLGAN